MSKQKKKTQCVLGEMPPVQSIIKLALPATLALLAKAIYNLVDTAYIGMLDSDIALTAVGVTVPLLLIMVSIENIFAAGAAVLAGRQLGAKVWMAQDAQSQPSSASPSPSALRCAPAASSS